MLRNTFNNGFILGLLNTGRLTVDTSGISSLTFNADGTVSVVDLTGITHIITPVYGDDTRITALQYDGRTIPISESLLGTTELNSLENYPKGDAIIITSRDANGYPLTADITPLTIRNNTLYSSLFMAIDANGIGRTLTAIKVPPGITIIGSQCFMYDMALTSISTLDWNTIIYVGTSAFRSCNNLLFNNINAARLTQIADYAFASTDTMIGSLTLGSPGVPIRSPAAHSFTGQTQLTTINVYTQNGLASDLTNAPWGAVNATINYIQA